MIAPVELTIDVTTAADIGQPARTAVTVFLPEPSALADPPVICFAFPGGGYSRGYFSFDMPGGVGGGQAGWHVSRGWIFVACDHLGFGDSTAPGGNVLTFDNVARGNEATVAAVVGQLAAGTIKDGYPAISNAVKLGIGQSMGGCFTIVLQGQRHTFDGVATLGFSAIHTVVPARPGTPPVAWPWLLREAGLDNPTIVNQASIEAAAAHLPTGAAGEHPFTWAFHYDDEPADIVARDMLADVNGEPTPSWRSVPTPPSCGVMMVAPGAVATEAAAITVPVLIAVGERDVVPNPWLEPFAFKSSTDISVFVCPRMAHMHNFAHTRERFWRRIHSWGNGVAEAWVARPS
jgi:alpha-beta hydrolase superfamily lysophospholipase